MRTINVTRVIDGGSVTSFQVRAILLCSLVGFLDGLDSQNIAVAAPLIVEKLGLTRAALGPVFSAGLFGALLGALSFGPLGDMFGRKRMLIVAAVIFGVFTLATAQSTSLNFLLAARFLAGIGLGGATPCFIALASEYAPTRRRAMVASLIWASFPIGGTVGGFLNAYLLGNYGWPSLFYVGGTLPLIVALALLIWLPESLRFLLASSAPMRRVAAIVRRLDPSVPAGVGFVADEERIVGTPLRNLFTEGRALGTVLLWVPFFTAFGLLGITVLWTPTLLRENGIPLTQAAVVIGLHGAGALVGMAGVGRLIEAFGATRVLVPALLLGALVTATLGYAAESVTTMSIALIAIGLFIGAGASGSIALAALTYPTAMRSSGIGWAMGMGRFGQVLTPISATTMVAAGLNGGQMFVVFAIAPVVGAMAVLALRGSSRRLAQAAL